MPSRSPIEETNVNDTSQQGMVKCPQCGKMVNKAFPYCEFCTFPIGEMLQRGSDSNFIANELKEEKRQRSQGRRNAIDNLKVSRGTFVRVAGVIAAIFFIGIGAYVLNGVFKNTSFARHGGGNKAPGRGGGSETTWGKTNPRQEVQDENPIQFQTDVEEGTESSQQQQTPSPSSTVPVEKTWIRPKDWYETQCQEVQRRMKTLCSGGYLFDRSDAVAVARQLKALRKAISEEDASSCNSMYEELAKQFKSFSESCRWQQGLKHSKIPHIVSAYQRGVWNAEDGYEFVNPGTSDLTVREKVQQLSHSPDWYIRECDVICQNVRNAQNAPYYYDSRLANQTLSKAQHLRSKVYSEKPNVVDGLCLELQQTYREFKSTCRWRSGVRHPNIAHVISSTRENTWNAESGWEFVNPGTSDLTVRRSVIAQECNKCRGTGRILANYRCTRCGGNGRIRNPASDVGQTVMDVVGIFGGRNTRRIRNAPPGRAFITCPDCGGRRFSTQETSCDNCGGLGQRYK